MMGMMRRTFLFLWFVLPIAYSAELIEGGTYRDPKTGAIYEVVQELGAGGFGKVYRVLNLLTGKEEAIKVFRGSEGDSTAKHVEALFADVKSSHLGNSLLIPAAIQIVPADESSTLIPAQKMELMSGDLRELGMSLRLTEDGMEGMEMSRRVIHLLHIFPQLLRPIEALRAGEISHRDINPANFFYSKKGQGYSIKLADPDAAVSLRHQGETYQVVGTAPYMPPEAFSVKGYNELTPEADFYSTAATMFYLMTGKNMYQNADIHIASPRDLLMLMFDNQKLAHIQESAAKTLENLALLYESKAMADSKLKAELVQELRQYIEVIKAGLNFDPKVRKIALEKNSWFQAQRKKLTAVPMIHRFKAACNRAMSWLGR